MLLNLFLDKNEVCFVGADENARKQPGPAEET